MYTLDILAEMEHGDLFPDDENVHEDRSAHIPEDKWYPGADLHRHGCVHCPDDPGHAFLQDEHPGNDKYCKAWDKSAPEDQRSRQSFRKGIAGIELLDPPRRGRPLLPNLKSISRSILLKINFSVLSQGGLTSIK